MFGRCPESSHCDSANERRMLAVAQNNRPMSSYITLTSFSDRIYTQS